MAERIKAKDISIIDVAAALGINIKNSPIANEYPARCPFCDDAHTHLSLNAEKNAFRCNRCGTSGGVLQFYALLNDCSRTEAYKEILMRNFPEYAYKQTIVKSEDHPVKPIESRHLIYSDFLELLVLADVHKMDLIRRGLSLGTITNNQYKSIPLVKSIRSKICEVLSRKYDLRGIPGFFIAKDGMWDFYNVSGFLIPVRDEYRRIQGLQVRRDHLTEDDDKRYKWFSSRGMKNGSKAETFVHIIGNDLKKGYITEGPLKGDVAHELSGKTFVCIPGVNCLKYLVPTVNRIGMEEACTALDMDMIQKIEVMRALVKIHDMLKRDTKVKTIIDFHWEAEYRNNRQVKGVDDFLLYRRQLRNAANK